MDIEGFGSRLAEIFVEKGLLKDIADLYSLRYEQLMELEGFEVTRTNNLLRAIEASKQRPLGHLISALGISGIGGTVAGQLARHFRSLDALMAATVDDLRQLEGVGPTMAQSIVDFFSRPRHREIIAKLRAAGVRLEEEAQNAVSGPLMGKTFVITGTLPTISRERAAELIEHAGGKVTGSVSAKTDYLLLGDSPGAAKYDKARKLNTPMISEDDLKRLIGLVEAGL
jgi:DNA ligase (NAD+)